MPSFSKIAIAFLSISYVLAAPVPQLAGEGSAAGSILTDTDSGTGYAIEDAENNLAGNVATLKATAPATRRQLAGEGSAADSILTDTDSGTGYGIEDAEDNLADNISTVTGDSPTTGASSGGSSSGSPPPPPPKGGKARRQLNKIANGAGEVGNASGLGETTDPVVVDLNNVDGSSTNLAANAGAEVGSDEESTLESVGSSVPKARRQLNKIANGAGTVGDAAGVSSVTDSPVATLDNVDGESTTDAANAGAAVGNAELSTFEGAGSAVPKL